MPRSASLSCCTSVPVVIGGLCVLALGLVLPATINAEGAKRPQTLPRTADCVNSLCFTDATAVNDSGIVVGNRSGVGLRWVGTAAPQDLGSLGSGGVHPSGIDNLGRIVGSAGVSGGSHAFLWTEPAGIADLGTLGGVFSGATGINDNGQVVGYADTAGGQRHAFLWTDGAGMVDLGTLGGSFSSAAAINATGAIVGSSTTLSGETHAFLWTVADGMIDLGTLGGTTSDATDINAGGSVVGHSLLASGRRQAFIWTATGGMRDLATEDNDNDSWAYGISDLGQVVGTGVRPYSWTSAGGLAALGTGGYQVAVPRAVNNTGTVVGRGDTCVPRFNCLGTAPILWQWTWDDIAVDLGTVGVWRLGDRGTAWTAIHNLNPTKLARGDVDGNGVPDLVLDFGPGVGVWIWKNHATWMQLHNLSASHVAVVDVHGDAREDVVLSFTGAGLWLWSEDTSWRRINVKQIDALAVGARSLLVTFPGEGTWLFRNGWLRIDSRDASVLLIADVDLSPVLSDNPQAEFLLGIPGAGLWKYHATDGLSQVHPFDVRRLAAGDLDGVATDDVVVDFGPAWGLWRLDNGLTWSLLHPFTSAGVTLADLDGLGRDEVVVNFGPPHGLWRYSSHTGWALLHDWQIDGVVTAVLH